MALLKSSLVPWPHQVRPSRALVAMSGLSIIRAGVLALAAVEDGTLWLPGASTGLLEHPGILGLLIGDVLLFWLSSRGSRLTRKVGHKLPSTDRRTSRSHFSSVINPWAFGRRGIFFRAVAFFFVLGLFALANQTVRLTSPVDYYGHDTFNSLQHPWSFWANRINLFVSWCVVTPLFAAYILTHCLVLRRFIRYCWASSLATFYRRHPDRCGGYSYFGWTDAVYVAGIIVLLFEVVLMIVTHSTETLGTVLSLVGLGIAALCISFFSIFEVLRLLKKLERRLKASEYARGSRKRGRTSVEYATLMFGLKFSPYTTTSSGLAVGLRMMAVAPAVYRITEYINAGALRA